MNGGIILPNCTEEYNMCKTHNKITGKDTVIAFERIRRGMDIVCNARRRYVIEQVKGFMSWLESQGCEDAAEACRKMVYWHFDAETDVSDMQLAPASVEPTVKERLDVEWELNQEMEAQMERIADKAQWSMDAKLSYVNHRIDQLEKELKLHDKIQDGIESHLKDRRMALAMKRKLQQYKDEKKLSWDGFVIFTNQVHEFLGWKQIQLKEGTRILPERLRWWEKKKDEIVAQEAEKALEYHETDPDRLDDINLCIE